MLTEVREVGPELAALMAEFFPEHVVGPAVPPPVIGMNNQDVVDRVRKSKQGSKFDRLMNGDTSEYGGDDSSADMALCSILSFWCSGPDQVDRLFRQSKLYRDKWDQRRGAETYGELTVRNAWEGAGERYKGSARAAPYRLPLVDHVVQPTAQEADLLELFKSAQEIAARVSVEPDWVVVGLLAAGAITELDAKQKVGKSTLFGYMCKAIMEGSPFLGFATARTPIVMLTEEGEQTIRELIEVCGLQDASDLHIVSKRDTLKAGLDWPGAVALAKAKAISVGAKVICIDTLSKWAGIQQENDTGEWQVAMEPLEIAASEGVAVFCNRHDRKSGGEVGDSGRGASAVSGATDIILHLQRAPTEGHPNRRILDGVGRFRAVPASLVLELTDEGYVNLGDALDVERRRAKEVLLDKLPTTAETAWKLAEIRELEGLERIGRNTIDRALKELVEEGMANRAQSQGRGKPLLYWRVSDDAFHSSQLCEPPGKKESILPDEHLTTFEVETHLEGQASLSSQPPDEDGKKETCVDCGEPVCAIGADGTPLCQGHAT